MSGERDVIRPEHAKELCAYLGLSPFGLSDFRVLVLELTDLAQQADKGLLLVWVCSGKSVSATADIAHIEGV